MTIILDEYCVFDDLFTRIPISIYQYNIKPIKRK